MNRRLVWFSCGAPSAVLAKIAITTYENCEVVYCDTMATEHPDNGRFFHDIQGWIQRPIIKIHSERYNNINEVFEKTRYMAGIAGARCTTEMKKLPREAFQLQTDTHLFGFTKGEEKRAAEFEANNPELNVEWPLIERNITKNDCYAQLWQAGIKLPAMYELGFDHNNCLGCVKATSPAYWNKIRQQFPHVFAQRARQSRLLGARLVRIDGERRFLDELPERDLTDLHEQIECGPVCQSTLW